MQPISTEMIVCVVLTALLGGCRQSPEKPEGFPELLPVTLYLKQEGRPLEAATATLIPEDKSSKWGSGGFSDETGKVVLRTGGNFTGVPAGRFKVVVTKNVTEGAARSADERGDPKTYTLVAANYTSPDKTPLQIEVSAGTTELTLDVGKPVKERVD